MKKRFGLFVWGVLFGGVIAFVGGQFTGPEALSVQLAYFGFFGLTTGLAFALAGPERWQRLADFLIRFM